MDDAYAVLKKLKHNEESFSEVIRRISNNHKTDLRKWFGKLNKDDFK